MSRDYAFEAAHAAYEDRILYAHTDGPEGDIDPIIDVGNGYIRHIETGRFVTAEKALEIIEEDSRISGYPLSFYPEYSKIEDLV